MAVQSFIPQFVYHDGQPVTGKTTGLKKEPYTDINDLRELLCDVLNSWAEENRVPSPVKVAQEFSAHLVLTGNRSEEEDILYDFDDHYKVKFNIGEVPYYFETWRTWQGALNCTIIEDLA